MFCPHKMISGLVRAYVNPINQEAEKSAVKPDYCQA